MVSKEDETETPENDEIQEEEVDIIIERLKNLDKGRVDIEAEQVRKILRTT